MKQSPALPWVLALLDDGLRLYRRHLLGFMLIGAAVLVPLTVVDLLINTLIATQLGDDWTGLGLVFRFILLYPAILYIAGALSRATIMVAEGEPIRVGAALRIGLGRVVGMGCYNVLFTIIVSFFFSILSLLVACPILYGSLFGVGILSSVGGGGMLGAAGGVFVVVVGVGFLLNLAISGAQIVGSVYAVQTFVLEDRSFGNTLSRNVDLLTFRFGRNLLMFLGGGTVFAMLVLVYIGTLVAGGAALFSFLDIEPSPLLISAATSVLITASAALFFPPVAIWMALLHQRSATERDAADLVASIEQWRGSVEPAAGT